MIPVYSVDSAISNIQDIKTARNTYGKQLEASKGRVTGLETDLETAQRSARAMEEELRGLKAEANEGDERVRRLSLGVSNRYYTIFWGGNVAAGLVNQHFPTDDLIVIHPKGEFVAAGTTSFVERLPSGDIIKTPWAGDIREEDCRKEIAVEARIYQRLGEHPRLVKLKGWDPQAHVLMLEYMPNGTLENYMKLHHGQTSMARRLRWIAEAAEALHLLHSMGIIHCDVGPHNLLLDADMNLKIADFSGSSIDGSRAMVCPGTRYAAPDPHWKPGKPPTVEEDLFSLGSTAYYIIMGKAPFDKLLDEEVERKYLNGEFPDLAGVLCGNIIKLCWLQEVHSAQLVRELVDKVNVDEGL